MVFTVTRGMVVVLILTGGGMRYISYVEMPRPTLSSRHVAHKHHVPISAAYYTNPTISSFSTEDNIATLQLRIRAHYDLRVCR